MVAHPAVVEAIQRAIVKKRWLRRQFDHATYLAPHWQRLLTALADEHIAALEHHLHTLHPTEVSHAQIYPLPG